MTPRTTDDTSGLQGTGVTIGAEVAPRGPGSPHRRAADATPPAHWPRQIGWKTLWDNVIGYQYPAAQPRAT